MSQIVTINGRPNDLDWEPSLKVGTPPLWRPPIAINSEMVHGVTINGYDYPPCPSGAVLHMPGLPGQGATIWDRSRGGNHGTIIGATWRRLPSGLWYLHFDGDDNINCGSDASLDLGTGPFSIWLWVRITATAASYQRLFSFGTTADQLEMAENNLNLKVYDGTGWIGSSLTLTLDTWTFVGLTRVNDDYVVYMNLSTNSLANKNQSDIDEKLILGARARTGANAMTGDGSLFGLTANTRTTSMMAKYYQETKHLFGV